jgi:hypothetical protein
MKYKHTRLLAVPEADALNGAFLEAIHEETPGRQRDVALDYCELRPSDETRLYLDNGKPMEAISGWHIPRRLRLHRVTQLELSGLFFELGSLPPEHPARQLDSLLYFRATAGQKYFLLFPADGAARLMADPQDCSQEMRPEPARPVSLVRDWSPAPVSPPRRVPRPASLHACFGGDPVTVHLGGRRYHRRLFIGDLDMQGKERPQVDAVLNLGEQPADWFQKGQAAPADRWVNHGEGNLGMNLIAITTEAEWVLEKLRRGQRVLVHCLAGMNRSATVCCAVLILLEGISAQAALERLRQHHPWASPDAYHLLCLRWMTHKMRAG